MDDYDIISYGIGMTTLEEVFIKCNGENEGRITVKPNKKIEEQPKIDDEPKIDPTPGVNILLPAD